MLTPEEIKNIVASGEGYNTEFKVSLPSKIKEVTEEICAFANSAGGVLFIGVDNDNLIKGISIDNNRRSALQNGLGEITPVLDCEVSYAEVDGKSICVIEVPSGKDKPYVLSGVVYVRNGPNTQKLTTAQEMRDFFQQSGAIFFDEAPCKTFNHDDDLDGDLFNEFKADARLSGGVPNIQIFKSLKMITPEGYFKNGAVLFFGKSPQEHFEHAILRCVAFDGNTKRFITDDKRFDGPLIHQYNQALQWIKGKINVGYDIEGQGSGPRKEIWEIPQTALKEALINSLAHRDYYQKGATITVELFEDRLEISNPGGLVSAIERSELGTKSHSRNPLIFGLFTRMNMVEQIGSGIPRMNELMIGADLPAPVYKTSGMFTVIFQRPAKHSEKASEKTSEKTSEKIIRYIKANPKITIKELAELTGRATRTVELQLQKLSADKTIARIGSDKGGHWKVNEE